MKLFIIYIPQTFEQQCKFKKVYIFNKIIMKMENKKPCQIKSPPPQKKYISIII